MNPTTNAMLIGSVSVIIRFVMVIIGFMIGRRIFRHIENNRKDIK